MQYFVMKYLFFGIILETSLLGYKLIGALIWCFIPNWIFSVITGIDETLLLCAYQWCC